MLREGANSKWKYAVNIVILNYFCSSYVHCYEHLQLNTVSMFYFVKYRAIYLTLTPFIAILKKKKLPIRKYLINSDCKTEIN